MATILVVSVLIAIISFQSAKAEFNFTQIVNTTSGTVRGKIETLATGKVVRKYLGIRYATAKRFEYPTDPERWNITFNSTSFGKHCPQPTRDPRDPTSNVNETSEDCLLVGLPVEAPTLKMRSVLCRR
ncbi:hypothetical protein QZH41_000785 [Actinostola sp. cb2023]|nr:hypothetical protein QZH41_000785 [Actinostola sp. cb2023]